jgi:hypothetical protein
MVSSAWVLPGQEALVASWQALARLSPGARLIRSTAAVAAVLPGDLRPTSRRVGLETPFDTQSGRVALAREIDRTLDACVALRSPEAARWS